MAVVAKYVVVREGKELERVFSDKKEAEAYDSMLDAAQGLAELIKHGDLQLGINDKVIDDISIHLAENAPDVIKILKPVKSIKPASDSGKKAQSQSEGSEQDKEHAQGPRKPKSKAA
jgi:dsDNA-binding SOS-regulon protein